MAEDRNVAVILRETLRNLKTGQALQRQAQQAVSAVSGHVREVLGPFAEVTDFIKNTFKNVGGFVKGLATDLGFFKKKTDAEKEQEKQTGYLEGILNTLIAQQKEKFREGIGKKKLGLGWGLVLGALGWLAFSIGALAGGFLKALWVPFKLILTFFKGLAKRIPIFGTMFEKGLKALRNMFLRLPKSKFVQDIIVRIWMFWTQLSEWFGKTRVARLFKGVGRFFKRIGSFFGRFRRLFGILKPVAKIFSASFLKGFLKGFKILGWPILMIMTVIDFIKGFMQTEGTILKKIEEGISIALQSFWEWPIKIFGWIGEKIWGFITGAKIEKGSYAKVLFDLIDKLVGVLFHPLETLMKAVEGFSDFFRELWNGMMTGIIKLAGKLPDWIPGVGAVMDAAMKMKIGKIPDKPDEVDAALQQKSRVEAAVDAKKDKTAHELLDINKELSKNMKDMQESQVQAGANIVTAVSSKKEKDVQEPPSGIEEAASMWLNLAM